MSDIIKALGIISGIAIVLIPIMFFFIKQFFSDIQNDIKEMKSDIRRLPCQIHESRISKIEGMMESRRVTDGTWEQLNTTHKETI